jgi:hypothetical protein
MLVGKSSSDGTDPEISGGPFSEQNLKLAAITTRMRETGGRRREFIKGWFDGMSHAARLSETIVQSNATVSA